MENPTVQAIKAKYTSLEPVLDERARRLWAAVEARAIGRGGITRVAEATGLSRVTIRAGLRELDPPGSPTDQEPARPGGYAGPGADESRWSITTRTSCVTLETLVDPVTRGDPMSPLRWTCKSAAKLAAELRARGACRQRADGQPAPPRPGLQPPVQPQDDRGQAATRTGMPSSSTSTGGSRRSSGRGSPWSRSIPRRRSWWASSATAAGSGSPRGEPEEVKVHDFVDKDLGKAIPYGVYDQTADTGWVSVGVDHDTAEFAVETLRRWWRNMGSRVYPAGEAAADHGRRRRLQREPMPAVEGGAAAAGRRDRAEDLGVPLPAGHQQVEQDRAPDVLPHHGELAGPPAGEP